jgi:PAS domain S-box-containing protein
MVDAVRDQQPDRGDLALLRALVDHLPAMVAYWDVDHRCCLANRAYEARFGFTPEALVGKHMRELLGPVYLLNLPYIEQVLRGHAQEFVREIPDPKGGPPRYWQSRYIPDVGDGAVRGFFALVSEITDRRRAEEATRLAEDELRVAIEHAPIGMAIVGTQGRWLRVNRVLCELFGYSAEELQQMTFADVTHPDDLLTDVEHTERLLAGQSPRYELAKRYIRKDGSIVDAMLHVSLVRDERGLPKHFIVQLEDLTERKKLEERMMRADRMVSLGTLAAGVAHEINNPLAYVLANLDALGDDLRRMAGDEPSHAMAESLELVHEAREGADRVRKIVRGLKVFSRPIQERLAPIDVNRALDAALAMSLNEVRHRARVVRHRETVPHVLAEDGRLGQVFVNLVVNAAQAMVEGRADENLLTVRTFSDERGRVIVEIRDTGHGIPPAVLGRIFEPFFTTRAVGTGTGLGLSIAHGIVSSFGGEISVESEVGVGTVMRVSLPSAPFMPEVEAADVTPPPATAGARGRVLIIDDEVALGRAIARALRHDYDVTVATSGKDGLAQIRADRFDAVVTDLIMPHMTGMDLHAAILTEEPALADRMVFITGDAFTASARAFLEATTNPRLDKPIEMSNLRAILRELCARRR